MDIQKYAQEIINHEASMIGAMADRIDESFCHAVDAILSSTGRVIVTGMGKSGLIGRKIAATFNSIGISSYFLHPAEAMHGDLGIIQTEDLLMVISKSGQLQEAEEIIGAVRRLSGKIIVLSGTPGSSLSKRADITLDCSVKSEACPNNLVPTSSSTAALVMGDALAIALLKARNFSPSDFAVLHPGGFLGHRLLKKVSDLHHSGDDLPLISAEARLSEMLVCMTSKRLGCVLITDNDHRLRGIFTDGDLRRLIAQKQNPDLINLSATEVMISDFKTINENALLDTALALMEKHAITQLPTIDNDDRLAGLIHLHDILKSRLV